MRCGLQEITIFPKKVRVSLSLMGDLKGKNVLDVEVNARDTDTDHGGCSSSGLHE